VSLASASVSIPATQSRWTPLLLLSTLIAALGGLLFGLDTAVISGTTASLTIAFHLTPRTLGFTVSSALLGTIVGVVLAGYGAERFGRSFGLRISALFFVISALGCALSYSWWVLIAFRVAGGLGIGGASVLAPMYIAEIAPAELRGRLVAMFQINIVLGILLAYFSNYLVGLRGLGATEWRWELGVTAIPAAAFLFALIAIPESPRWLVKRDRRDEALKILERIGETDPAAQIARIDALSAEETQRGSRARLFTRQHSKAILLALTMGLFNQLTGINSVLYFLNDIFSASGLNSVSGSLRGIAIGATNLVFTIFAMFFIDRFGRRFLLMVGSVAMAAMLMLIGYCFQTQGHGSWLLWLLIAYCGSFSFSSGTVTWVYMSELFPLDVREKGQALGSNAHWVANAIISASFPVVLNISRSLPFYFFGSMMVLQFFIVMFLFPETKGRSLESDATVVAH
jgi:MFS transporter, SP family, arabinose:H+ symporter